MVLKCRLGMGILTPALPHQAVILGADFASRGPITLAGLNKVKNKV